MANLTSHYNLEKATENEFYDVNLHGRNMDKIDQALKNNVDETATKEIPAGAQAKANTAENNAKTFASGLVGSLSSLLTTAKSNIVAAINELKGNHDAHKAESMNDAHLGKNIGLEDTEGHFAALEVEGALHELFTNVSDGKTQVASAITDMGQAASGSDAFAALAAKIRDISDDATAAVGNVLAGKTFYQGGAKRTGTMPNNGSLGTITPGTANQSIPAGYTTGGTVIGDADLVSANIKAGKNIFGVAGSSTVVDTSAGDATAAQILSGKKAYVDGSLVTGTMANKTGGYATDSLTYSGTQLRMSIDSAGYFSDSAYLYYNEADWVESNIKAGVNIFGKAGTLQEVQASAQSVNNSLYYTDLHPDVVYEINSDSLAVINSASSPGLGARGIGGVIGELYHVDDDTELVYELNPNTLAVIRSTQHPGSVPWGVGGTKDNLYISNSNSDYLYEVNLITLASINSSPAFSGAPRGIGGIDNRLYNVDNSGDDIYEISSNTLASIRNVSSPSSDPQGIGGTNNRLYHSDNSSKLLYELNPDNLSVINTHSLSYASGTPLGIGGMKGGSILTISNQIELSNPDKIIYLGVSYFN
ncbi:MAG: hypothetical protein ACOWWO_12045 [Peptococcaceae bacterium]